MICCFICVETQSILLSTFGHIETSPILSHIYLMLAYLSGSPPSSHETKHPHFFNLISDLFLGEVGDAETSTQALMAYLEAELPPSPISLPSSIFELSSFFFFQNTL